MSWSPSTKSSFFTLLTDACNGLSPLYFPADPQNPSSSSLVALTPLASLHWYLAIIVNPGAMLQHPLPPPPPVVPTKATRSRKAKEDAVSNVTDSPSPPAVVPPKAPEDESSLKTVDKVTVEDEDEVEFVPDLALASDASSGLTDIESDEAASPARPLSDGGDELSSTNPLPERSSGPPKPATDVEMADLPTQVDGLAIGGDVVMVNTKEDQAFATGKAQDPVETAPRQKYVLRIWFHYLTISN